MHITEYEYFTLVYFQLGLNAEKTSGDVFSSLN